MLPPPQPLPPRGLGHRRAELLGRGPAGGRARPPARRASSRRVRRAGGAAGKGDSGRGRRRAGPAGGAGGPGRRAAGRWWPADKAEGGLILPTRAERLRPPDFDGRAQPASLTDILLGLVPSPTQLLSKQQKNGSNPSGLVPLPSLQPNTRLNRRSERLAPLAGGRDPEGRRTYP